MHKRNQSPKKRSGFVLITALLILSLSLTWILAAATRAATDLMVANRFASVNSSFHLAEAGLDRAYKILSEEFKVDNQINTATGLVLASCAGLEEAEFPGGRYLVTILKDGLAAPSGCRGGIPKGTLLSDEDIIAITSVGTSASGAQRTLQLKVRLLAFWRYALTSSALVQYNENEYMSEWKAGEVDGCDSSQGESCGAANPAVEIKVGDLISEDVNLTDPKRPWVGRSFQVGTGTSEFTVRGSLLVNREPITEPTNPLHVVNIVGPLAEPPPPAGGRVTGEIRRLTTTEREAILGSSATLPEVSEPTNPNQDCVNIDIPGRITLRPWDNLTLDTVLAGRLGSTALPGGDSFPDGGKFYCVNTLQVEPVAQGGFSFDSFTILFARKVVINNGGKLEAAPPPGNPAGPPRPTMLQIQVRPTEATCPPGPLCYGVTIDGGELNGIIYTPTSGIKIIGGGRITGAAVSAWSTLGIDNDSPGSFRYDKAVTLSFRLVPLIWQDQ